MRYQFPAAAIVAALGLTAWSAAAAQSTDSVSSQAAAPAPAPPAETVYTLVTVGGRPLPVETEKEWRCREEVTGGTLALGEGRWRLETSTRETCGDRTTTDRDSEHGSYRTEGTSIRFLDDDGRENSRDRLERDLDLDDLRTGTLGGGELSVRLADEETVLVFRRQGS